MKSNDGIKMELLKEPRGLRLISSLDINQYGGLVDFFRPNLKSADCLLMDGFQYTQWHVLEFVAKNTP